MSLKRSLLYTFFTQFPQLFISIISGILITRMLGPAGKGAYAIFIANVQLFLLFLSGGLSSSIAYFVAKKYLSIQKIIGIALLVSFIGIVILGLAFFVQEDSMLVKLILPDGYTQLFFRVYLVLGYLIALISAVFNSILSGSKKFDVISKLSIFQTLFLICIVTLIYIFWRKELTAEMLLISVLLATVGSNFLTMLLKIISVRQFEAIWPSFSITASEIKMLLSFSGITYLSTVLNFFNYRLDLWIVDEYNSADDVGYYALAVNLAQMLWMLSVPLSSVLTTYLSNNNDIEYRLQVLKAISRITSTTAIVICVVGYLTVDYLLPILYGKEFFPAILPFKILLPGLVLSTIYKIFVPINVAHEKISYNLIAVALSLVVTVVLDLLLIPKFGIQGAAIATSLAYASSFFTILYFVIVKLDYPLTNYFLVQSADVKFIKQKLLKK